MTVIAYRDGILAGDGRVSYKDFIDQDNYPKVKKINGTLFGASGVHINAIKLLMAVEQAAKAKGKTHELPSAVFKGVEAILVDPKGGLWWYGDGGWEKLSLPYMAIGSGGTAAMVALDMGASAEEAVRAAIKRVSSCGGRVRKVKLD